MSARHGPVVETRMPFMRIASLFGPEASRFLLLDRSRVLSAKLAWEFIMGRIFGGGLLLRDGDDHRHHRSIMQVAFKQAALDEYVGRMEPRIAETVHGWAKTRTEIDAFPAFKHLTLDLASEVFLGLELGPGLDALNRAFEATVAASMSIVRIPVLGREFSAGLAGRRYMTEFFGKLIPERRAGDGADMFSRLCHAESEDGGRFSDREIVDHLNFLMMAAHDTTTSTLTSMSYLLAKHPRWQARVREECAALGDRALSYADLESMEVTHRVMQETLRLYPPLSTIPRMALEDFEFEGYRIRKGTLVSAYPIHTHYLDDWWTEPFAFDPDRFAPERAEHKRHTHLWVPFGGGAHMCLGMLFAELQIKTIMHRLVLETSWEVAPGYEMPVQQAPISKPLDGLPLRLTSPRT